MNHQTAYKDWIHLFDEDVLKVWQTESTEELKTISMMIFTIKREFKKVTDKLDCRFTQIKKQVANKSSHPSVICNDKENVLKEKFPSETLQIPSTNRAESPDMFHICDKSDKSVVVSDGDDCQMPNKLDSPEIKKTKRSNLKRSVKLEESGHSKYIISHSSKQKGKTQVAPCTLKQSTAKEMRDFDTSVVAATPPLAKIIPKRGFKSNSFLQKKQHHSQNNSTLTQMFLSHKKFEIPDSKEKGQVISNDSNLDETYVDLDCSQDVGITKMIGLINKEEPSKNLECQSIDFGFGLQHTRQVNNEPISTEKKQKKCMKEEESGLQTFLYSNGINEFFARAQGVPDHQLEAEPIVRGKARQNLPGWACKDCEKFYVNQGLNKTELMTLNKCSKHRGVYRPREDTMPGYWDMNMITQEGDTE